MPGPNPYDVGSRMNTRGYLTWDDFRFAPLCPEPGRPIHCPKDGTRLDQTEQYSPGPDYDGRTIEVLVCDCGHRYQLNNECGRWQLTDMR